MKYFAQTLFSGTSISTANTSGTSEQYDISEISNIWLQCTGTGTSTATDIALQLQLSCDPMSKLAIDSTWINESTASSFLGTASFAKFSELGALKARVQVTRNGGAANLTVISVGKWE